MRKIDITIRNKIALGKSFKEGNTRFVIDDNKSFATLYLHNNPIIRYKYDRGIFIPTHVSLDRWDTLITRRRINSLVDVISIFRKNKTTYYRILGSSPVEMERGTWVSIECAIDILPEQLNLFN